MADALKSLENVTNARDFATATPNIAPGRIFRSGNPANGTAGDVQVLRMQLGIRQMLDFRSSEEHAEDKGWPLMLSRGTMKTYDANGQLSEVSVAHNEQLAGLDLPPCELHTLSLLERNRFIRALIWRLPPWKVAQALGYKALGYEEQMRDVLVP